MKLLVSQDGVIPSQLRQNPGSIIAATSSPVSFDEVPPLLEQTLSMCIMDVFLRWRSMQGAPIQGIVIQPIRKKDKASGCLGNPRLTSSQQESLGITFRPIHLEGEFRSNIAEAFQTLLHHDLLRHQEDGEKIGNWWLDFRTVIPVALDFFGSGKMILYPQRSLPFLIQAFQELAVLPVSQRKSTEFTFLLIFCRSCGWRGASAEASKGCPCCGSSDLHRQAENLNPCLIEALWLLVQLGWTSGGEGPTRSSPTSVIILSTDQLLEKIPLTILLGLLLFGGPPFQEIITLGPILEEKQGKRLRSRDQTADIAQLLVDDGASALRFFWSVRAFQGRAVRFSLTQVHGYRRFIRKIRNASRFISMSLKGNEGDDLDMLDLSVPDRWILHLLNTKTQFIQTDLDEFRWNRAAESLYQLIWHEYCDWYLELAKADISRSGCRKVLKWTLARIIQLLFPFMPRIAAEIGAKLYPGGEWQARNPLPWFDADLVFWGAHEEVENLKRLISKLRKLRRREGDSVYAAVSVLIKPIGRVNRESLERNIDRIRSLSRNRDIEMVESFPERAKMVAIDLHNWEIRVPFDSEADWQKEVDRLCGELSRVEKVIFALETQAEYLRLCPSESDPAMQSIREKLLLAIDRRAKVMNEIERLS